jgi:hypothetical protein
MKKSYQKPKEILQKVRNRLHIDEVYYTYSHWPVKDIDGVAFLPIIKEVSEHPKVFYMRKDNLEYVK